LAEPKTGAQRASLQMRLTGRRAAAEAAADAQHQLQARVITAPEAVRARFRGQSTPGDDLDRHPATPDRHQRRH
jgi:hypothetical protein